MDFIPVMQKQSRGLLPCVVGYAWFDPETDDGSGYNYSEDLIPQLPKIYETIYL
jgi:hypothetical protein